MPNETTRYSLQMRPVELCSQSDLGVLEMEIVAQPDGPGEAIRTRSRQWLPILRAHLHAAEQLALPA